MGREEGCFVAGAPTFNALQLTDCCVDIGALATIQEPYDLLGREGLKILCNPKMIMS